MVASMRSGGILFGIKNLLADCGVRFTLSSLGIVFGIGAAVALSSLDSGLSAVLEADLVSNLFSLSELKRVADVMAVWRPALIVVMLTALLVGAMSILSTMLFMAEKSMREIELRRALGARPLDIIGLFLLLPVVVCLIAGVAGIVLGVLGSLGFAVLLSVSQIIEGFVPIIHASVFVESVLISIIVGVLTGLYPAYRAAREPRE
jgi:putative ABC transport system permease protein